MFSTAWDDSGSLNSNRHLRIRIQTFLSLNPIIVWSTSIILVMVFYHTPKSNTVYEFYCYSDQFSSLSSRIKQLSNVDERLEADRAEGEDGQLSHSQSTPLNQGRTIAPCPLFSLFVPRRSLIIITSECYKTLLHSIPNRSFDDVGLHLKPCLNWSDHEVPSSDLIDGQLARDRRLSLTCRRVEKVMKGLGSFLK